MYDSHHKLWKLYLTVRLRTRREAKCRVTTVFEAVPFRSATKLRNGVEMVTRGINALDQDSSVQLTEELVQTA